MKSHARLVWFRVFLAMIGFIGARHGVTAQTNGAPSINAPVCAAPILDGALDDACWQAAPSVERLYPRGSGAASTDTTIRLARDQQWLYVGVECRNPRMPHVRQRVFQRGGPVFTDDSFSLYIRPDAKTKAVYEFVFSFANVQYDKRFTADGTREDAWSAPWRSATRVGKAGWTGEMAIPLFVMETEDLASMQVNLVRVFMEVKLDAMQAFESDQRVGLALRPGWQGSGFDAVNFSAVGGMGGFTPEIPFVPQIRAARATGYGQVNGKLTYGVALAVETGSPVGGAAGVRVVEDRGTGPVEVHAQTVNLEGGSVKELALNVPIEDFIERQVTVQLVESGRPANVLTESELDAQSLRVLSRAFVGLSYVTTEPMPVRLEFGLSDALLRDMTLVLEVNGAAAFEQRGLQAVMTPEIPLARLQEGGNAVKVRLMAAGRELAVRELTARRLAPRPGYEVKVDYIKGIMRKDGQPYFCLGLCAHFLYPQPAQEGVEDPAERVFKFLAKDIGLNTLVRTAGAEHLDRFVELADRYGLNVISWKYPQPDDLGEKFGTHPTFATGADSMPLVERRKIWRSWYEQLEPPAIAETTYLRERKNVIAYYNQDEPNLPPQDYRIAVAEWYCKTVNAIDPYRPLMLLFARQIPAGDNWTRWGEILGYDVYPNAYAGGHIYNNPGLGTAYYAHELRERCRQDGKVVWFVPFANLIQPARQQIGMSKAHILCQTYSAIIYGVRGVLYFSLPNVVGPDAWDGLRIACAQIKELSPALLNGDIPQEVRYPKEEFSPLERKFPMINAAVFQYPDGDYLLLAVNVLDYAAQTQFRVPGVRQAERLYGEPGKLDLSGDIFQDKIEGYGTRAYRLKMEKAPAVAAVEVTPTALPDEHAPRVDIDAIAAQLMMGKNYVPNPCFRQQTNPGVPDFYKPGDNAIDDGQKGSGWFVDDGMLWEGFPSLRLAKRMYGVYRAPLTAKPTRVTFSFYAKAAEPEASVSVTILSAKNIAKSFRPTPEWARYQFSFEVPPGDGKNFGLYIMRSLKGTWINGLQLEAGETATEFQDDSILVKKK